MKEVGKQRENLGADEKVKWIRMRQRVDADEKDWRQKESKKKGNQ